MERREPPGWRLEQYTLKRPGEVLLVTVSIAGELDQIMIYKGFSSSLMRPTAFDPDVPVIPPAAQIQTIDRLVGPYDPANPQLIAGQVSWADFQAALVDLGL